MLQAPHHELQLLAYSRHACRASQPQNAVNSETQRVGKQGEHLRVLCNPLTSCFM